MGERGSIEQACALVAERLRARRQEIEAAILARVFAITEPVGAADPEYAHGLRAAVSAAIDYGLEAIDRSEDRSPPIPAVLLTQARLAARAGVSLDTVLRRYLVGYTLLGDFVVQEAGDGAPLRRPALQRLLRAQAALFDRLLAAVSEEYAREDGGRPENAEQRRADRVRRLLAGELVDTADFNYELGDHHLGLIATGAGAAEAISDYAIARDRRLLLVRREEGAVWAWLGARRGFDREERAELVARDWPSGVTLALGEPAQGLAGWRLTHRQAGAALPIALRSSERVMRYADVALLASMLRDDLLATSLRELCLRPLESERDGGEVLLQTLRAYFSAERNTSSAACALNVSRRTVANRLRTIEERLGRPLTANMATLETALRLQELDESPVT